MNRFVSAVCGLLLLLGVAALAHVAISVPTAGQANAGPMSETTIQPGFLV